MNKLSFIVLLLACAWTTQASVTFSGNVSLSVSSKSDWEYRSTVLGSLLNIGWFSSVSVSTTDKSITADAIVGGITFLDGTFPGAFLAYFTSNGTVSIGSDFVTSGDISLAESAIGHSYYGIIEKNSAGDVVSVNKFNTYLWVTTDISLSGALKYVKFQGTLIGNSANVYITFLVSDQVGVVSLGGAVVTPKVLESVIEISSYPYQSSTNTLTLVMVAATGSGTADTTSLVSGSGVNQVYFAVNSTAVVDSKTQSVTVTSSSAAIADLNNDVLSAKLTGLYTSNYNVQIFNVTFPAGASDIVYDPTTGSGEQVKDEISVAATVQVMGIFMAIAGAVFSLLF